MTLRQMVVLTRLIQSAIFGFDAARQHQTG